MCDPDCDIPKFVTFGARDQDWKNFSVTKGAVSAHDSEVVFDQPVEGAGTMEPEGPLQSRHRKETWLEVTEPYRGARPRTMEFDRPVDGGLGATLGEVEDEGKLPGVALEDTVSRMRRDLEELQSENRFLGRREHQDPCPWCDRQHLRRQRYPGLMDRPVGTILTSV